MKMRNIAIDTLDPGYLATGTTPLALSYCLEHHIYAEKIMRPQFLDQKFTPKKHKL